MTSAAWPYSFEVLDVDRLFVDESYQRPLTNFAERIKRSFDPALVGTLVVSAREEGEHAGRFALVDGQTRAAAIRDLVEDDRAPGSVPCLVYYGLSQADEARLFAQLQKERRGISSYHRFRASLVAGDEEAVAIERIVRSAGYRLGEYSDGVISAVAALEKVCRRSPEILRRTLTILRRAWEDWHMPAGDVIRGLGALLDREAGLEDDRLVECIGEAGPYELGRRASVHREDNRGGGSDRYMANAIEDAYHGRELAPESEPAPTGEKQSIFGSDAEHTGECRGRNCVLPSKPGSPYCDKHTEQYEAFQRRQSGKAA